jgi:protein-S-isoprenylcysteine O-methyltransferase Ste14
MNNGVTMLALRSLFFTLLMPGSVTLLIPCILLNAGAESTLSRLGPAHFVGLVPMLSGTVIVLWPIWDFGVTGRGTLAPVDPPKTLVVRGLYRYVRNPMYIGVLLIVLGEAILFESLRLAIYVLILWLGFHLFVISYEEPTLRGKFGVQYEAYLQSVGRWIPRLRK